MNTIENNPLEHLGLSTQQTERSDDLSQEQFLELMIAQLKNQDPMKPMENGEFMGQLAQFSMVDGIQEMQESFAQFSTSFNSNQALQAAALIGRSVMTTAEHGQLAEEGALDGSVELPASTDNVFINIHDAAGNLVKRLELGSQTAGEVSFSWDGTAQDGSRAPVGEYQVNAEAQLDGEVVALDVATSKQVSSVSLGASAGDIQLNLSDGSTLDFANVRQIM